ncbi:TrbI/VirB10 family protein [Mesorhizobium loti]|uniref:TrbI/VirB10 family protein n=1 Tax=Rhizobium loti TaxID=381 RepID=UPI00040C408D|nr:TrbI/VirB10 family protein [Mesorhizobium loti]
MSDYREEEEQAPAAGGTPGPEPMRLRNEPPRVTRLSRRVLAGLGLVAGLGVGGALIYALQTRHGGPANEELYSTDNRTTADGLAGLPRDYSGVAKPDGPQLGPPLPGDLGRPILSAQNRGQPVEGVSAEEQRRLQEIEAARTSRLFAGTETRSAPAMPAPAPSQTPAMESPTLAGLGLAPQPATPTAQERQTAFLDAAVDRRTVRPDRVAAPAAPSILQAGSIISAALITGIRSDLPGQITAQVTENVYDSPTGRLLIIPQGARLIGQYDNGVGFGQRRVLLVWNRIIMPNGRSMVLERQPGADSEGYAGLEDGVDYHWRELFKAAALSTLLSIGAESGSSSGESDIVRALRQGASNSTSQIGQQIVGRQLDIAPTLTIRPGFPLRVIVSHDLVLEPYEG